MKSALGWTCLGTMMLVTGVGLWLLNEMRCELRRVTEIVNQQLPAILEKTRRSADTLAELSGDIKQLRELAGATTPRDQTLAAYADHVLDLIAASGGIIGTEKLIGKALKNPEPAAEWVVGARTEALLLTLRSHSRKQILDGLCNTKFGNPWHIQVGSDTEPQLLIEWVRMNDPESSPAP